MQNFGTKCKKATKCQIQTFLPHISGQSKLNEQQKNPSLNFFEKKREKE